MAEQSKQRGLGRGLAALVAEFPSGQTSLIDLELAQITAELEAAPPHLRRGCTGRAGRIDQSGGRGPADHRPRGGRRLRDHCRRAALAGRAASPVCAPFRRSSAAATIATAWYWRWPRTSPAVDLNPVDQARGYAVLSDELDLTQAEIARRVGKSRAAVANTMRLLELPDERARPDVGRRALRGPRPCGAAGRGPGRTARRWPGWRSSAACRCARPRTRPSGRRPRSRAKRAKTEVARWTTSWQTWLWMRRGHRSACERRCAAGRAAAESRCTSPTTPNSGRIIDQLRAERVSWAD